MFQPSPVLWYIRKALNSILLTYNEYRQPQLTILILYLRETVFTVPVTLRHQSIAVDLRLVSTVFSEFFGIFDFSPPATQKDRPA